jgi:hypothetical protein
VCATSIFSGLISKIFNCAFKCRPANHSYIQSLIASTHDPYISWDTQKIERKCLRLLSSLLSVPNLFLALTTEYPQLPGRIQCSRILNSVEFMSANGGSGIKCHENAVIMMEDRWLLIQTYSLPQTASAVTHTPTVRYKLTAGAQVP